MDLSRDRYVRLATDFPHTSRIGPGLSLNIKWCPTSIYCPFWAYCLQVVLTRKHQVLVMSLMGKALWETGIMFPEPTLSSMNKVM